MYISSDIADRIKHAAKQKNIPIKKLLEDVGLGFNTMSNMKTSMPKIASVAIIADYLDCSVDYLLGRTDDVQSHLSADKKATDDPGIELYAQLDTEDRAEVRGAMKQMLKADKYAARH